MARPDLIQACERIISSCERISVLKAAMYPPEPVQPQPRFDEQALRSLMDRQMGAGLGHGSAFIQQQASNPKPWLYKGWRF